MSQYSVYIVAEEFKAMRKLPGNVRQRIRRAIDGLGENPKPPESKQLNLGEAARPGREVCRLRIGSWRVIYIVTEADKVVDVVAIRKRPPYDYGDLIDLLPENS
jgi:mRNA interferase RelE/StbE